MTCCKMYTILLVFMVFCQTILFAGEEEEFNFAMKLFEDRNYLLAATQFKEFVQRFPQSKHAADAQMHAGEAYFEDGFYGKARDEYRNFLMLFEKDQRAAEVWYKLGLSLVKLGEWGETLNTFNHFREAFPADRQLQNVILYTADCYDNLSLPAEGVKLRKLFITKFPDSEQRIPVLRQMVQGMIVTKMDRDALESIEKILGNPKDAALQKEMRFKKISLLIEMKDFESALRETQVCLQLKDLTNFENFEIFDAMAKIYEAQGKFLEAIQNLEKSASLSEENKRKAEILYKLGELAIDIGDTLSCERSCKQILEMSDISEEQRNLAKYKLAIILKSRASFQEALDYLASFGDKDNKSCVAVVLLKAQIYSEQGFPLKASEAYLEASDLKQGKPGQDTMVFFASEALFENNTNLEKALELMADFKSRFRESFFLDEVEFNKALILEKLEKFGEAQDEYKKFVSTYCGSPYLRQALEHLEILEQVVIPDYKKAALTLRLEGERAIKENDLAGFSSILAEVTAFMLKDFESAVRLREAEFSKNPDSDKTGEILYKISEYQYYNYLKLEWEGKIDEALTEREKAINTLEIFLKKFNKHALESKAASLLLRLKYEADSPVMKSPDKKSRENYVKNSVKDYEKYVKNHPQDEEVDRALFQMSKFYVILAGLGDEKAMEHAVDCCQQIVDNYAHGNYLEDALYLLIKRKIEKGEESLVLGYILEYMDKFPCGKYSGEMAFNAGLYYRKSGEFKKAQTILSDLVKKYTYLPVKTTADSLNLEIFAETGQWVEVKDRIKSVKLVDGLSLSPAKQRLKLLNARALGYTGGGQKAINELKDLIKGNYSDGIKKEALDLLLKFSTDPEDVQSIISVLENQKGDKEFDQLLGEVYFQSAKYQDALSLYLKNLTTATIQNRKYIEFKIIMCLFRLGNLKEATKRTESFLADFPGENEAFGELLMEEALYHERDGKFNLAYELFVQIPKKVPSFSGLDRVYYQSALMMFKSGEMEKALMDFGRFVEAFPRSILIPDAKFKIGSCLFSMDKYNEAAIEYENFFKNYPDNKLAPDALYNLGLCEERAGKFQDALIVFREFLLKYYEHENAARVKFKIGYEYLKTQQLDDALTIFKEVVTGDDKELGAEVQYWTGEAYMLQNNYEMAVLEYLKVTFLYPDESEWVTTAEIKAAKIYELMGNVYEAKRLYNKILEKAEKGSQWEAIARQGVNHLQ